MTPRSKFANCIFCIWLWNVPHTKNAWTARSINNMHDQPNLPAEAKVIIVGGGIVGCSAAYHLAQFGWKDILLLEQNQLAGGTTWHAAGLVGRLRTSNSMTKINQASAELYSKLETETGHPTGWKQVGSLIAGRSADRMIQLQRTAAMAELFGVEVQIISPAQARDKFPLLRVDDLLGAAWLPHDGKVIPKDVAQALAQGARSHGVQIVQNCRVTDIEHSHGRVTGVRTDSAVVRADYVVICGGMWAREIGLRCGLTLPLYPVEHHYVLTEPIPGAFDELPVGRDPDLCIYFRGEGNAIMLGAFQKYTKPWMSYPVPSDFSFKLLEPDWEKFADPLRAGQWRIPAMASARFEKFVNGPESFTPDNNFLLGEAPGIQNLFAAAGFNSVGIASAGGAGRYLAEWMIEGQPTLDLWSVDLRRFAPFANNLTFLRERVTEVLGLHYQLAWPNREFETGRNLRLSPLHTQLAAAGASFGAKNGWERPNWFAPPGKPPTVQYSFHRQNWFEAHAAEHRAAREQVALFDQSGFSKYRITGRDCLQVLQRLCANNVDVPVGRIVYTASLNIRGGFECDLTLLRLAPAEFYAVSGTAQTIRDIDWIQRNLLSSEECQITDITNSFAVLGVMGPLSRNLLSKVTDTDLSNASFPFNTAQRMALGQSTVHALRITYVGELGWELHVPSEQAPQVLDTLLQAGPPHRLTLAGHYAINSLRLESAYRAWGADISPDDTPLEAGLSFAVAWNKPAPFLGREALLAQKAAGCKRRLVTFVLQDPEPVLWGSEPIYRDGRPVGYTTSGSYGHSLGAAIAMGYVKHSEPITAEWLSSASYEIGINGQRHRATVHLRPPFDPQRSRPRA